MIDNSYFCFGNLCFRQVIGVPIGVDPGPYIANLTLWFYEYSFINSLYKSDYRRALKLNKTFRLIDDISTLNSDGTFQELFPQIYPISLTLNKENVVDMAADVLDLNISIKDGKFIVNVYDKRDKFKFLVVRLTPRFSNQSDKIGYCTFNSQIIRFCRICNNLEGIEIRVLFLVNLFVNLGFSYSKLRNTFCKCIVRHKFNEQFIRLNSIMHISSD